MQFILFYPTLSILIDSILTLSVFLLTSAPLLSLFPFGSSVNFVFFFSFAGTKRKTPRKLLHPEQSMLFRFHSLSPLSNSWKSMLFASSGRNDLGRLSSHLLCLWIFVPFQNTDIFSPHSLLSLCVDRFIIFNPPSTLRSSISLSLQ